MLFDRALSQPVLSGSSCREFVPGVIQGLPGAPFLCYDFVLFVLFAAGVPALYPGGDSVRTGLPVLVLGHTGDCGRLLLILLCYCLAELCLCLWCTSQTGPTPLGGPSWSCLSNTGSCPAASGRDSVMPIVTGVRVVDPSLRPGRV